MWLLATVVNNLIEMLNKKPRWMNFDNKFKSFNNKSPSLRLHLNDSYNKFSVQFLKMRMRMLILFITPLSMLQAMIPIQCKYLRETTIAKETAMSKLTFQSSKWEWIQMIFLIGFILSRVFDYLEDPEERKINNVDVMLRKYVGLLWENLKWARVRKGQSQRISFHGRAVSISKRICEWMLGWANLNGMNRMQGDLH